MEGSPVASNETSEQPNPIEPAAEPEGAEPEASGPAATAAEGAEPEAAEPEATAAEGVEPGAVEPGAVEPGAVEPEPEETHQTAPPESEPAQSSAWPSAQSSAEVDSDELPAEPPEEPETARSASLSPSAIAALEQLATLASTPPEPVIGLPPVGPLPIDTLLNAGLLAGMSPARLATDFGTPVYVYDLDLIARRIDALGAVLPFGFRLAFAVKANPALGVLAHIAGTGIGADIASGGELETVLRAGFAPVSIAMTGPGKRDDELAAAVTAGIGAITIESPAELERLDGIAARLRRRQPVMLRLAVSGDSRLERVRLIGGADGKFGMPLPVLKEAAKKAAASPNLELLGVHAFGASNVTDAARVVEHISELVAAAREVAVEAGIPLRLVDAGGGLGIPYADDEPALDLLTLAFGLDDLRSRWDSDPAMREMEVLLEPGRFLVGPAGAYLARVMDVKGTPEAPVAILDGGIHHLVRPALIRQEQRLAVLAPDVDERPRVPVVVAGPLCTGLDVFTVSATLPQPNTGDLIAVLDAGAYGFTESMPFFLSHPTAAEVAVRGGQARLIRPRISPREMLDRQIAPRW
jgi:diaminopimelate decarboxylase